MVMIESPWIDKRLVYDVADPLHPRLICKIENTSAHFVTGDTIEWLVPLSGNETNIALRSLNSGIDTLAGTFPVRTASGSWLPDRSVLAYSVRVPADSSAAGDGIEVWLYTNQQRTSFHLFTYPVGIGDCICRFGLPPQVLAVSPDGQYVVAGWEAGKGSLPLVVYRVADHALTTTVDPSVTYAFWDRAGHRLFLNRFGAATTQAWTPETGVVDLAASAAWSYLPGLSPDGSQVAYTAYSDPNFRQPRVYVYDRKAGSTRMLVDQLRTQVLFVKPGWVWYLEERECTLADSCASSTMPTGKVFAMQLSGGAETPVTFGDLEDPVTQSGGLNLLSFGPGEFWPVS
jgi:hypothetical protein